MSMNDAGGKHESGRYVELELIDSRRRKVMKNGDCNVVSRNVSGHKTRFLQDVVTTTVDMKWRWVLLILASSFFISWFFFGVLWWLVSYLHGDFEPDHLPQMQHASNWTPCVTNIYNFTSSFMLSMENQHTTGFGARMPTEECPAAILLMCFQAIVGVTLQSGFIGLAFAKFIRPKKRAVTILFSRCGVICMRYGKLCLVIRTGDLRKSHIIENKVYIQLIQNRITPEGEVLFPVRIGLKLEANRTKTHFFLLWPEEIVHIIDKDSPLYELSAEDFANSKFEFLVVMEGTMDSTDQRVQARTSYLPEEILWGHTFCPIIVYNKERRQYEADYSLFDHTNIADTPICSAKDLESGDFNYKEDKLKNSLIDIIHGGEAEADEQQESAA